MAVHKRDAHGWTIAVSAAPTALLPRTRSGGGGGGGGEWLGDGWFCRRAPIQASKAHVSWNTRQHARAYKMSEESPPERHRPSVGPLGARLHARTAGRGEKSVAGPSGPVAPAGGRRSGWWRRGVPFPGPRTARFPSSALFASTVRHCFQPRPASTHSEARSTVFGPLCLHPSTARSEGAPPPLLLLLPLPLPLPPPHSALQVGDV
ncbi:uncharacterized protein LOC133350866 isoform X1 [Lethenteron reissneri]|uniref:uncharacterized protein LOC133350866 isoform X1 n=1 Tax=Lethenteron reissneri TaxID=7753 RepID=UPI002AB7EAF2|nr:uncharacterized protein LOC133350866 isoform X1 [Lethenteron reissneri]